MKKLLEINLLIVNPLKQGLKQASGMSLGEFEKLLIVNPLKQGLKHIPPKL